MARRLWDTRGLPPSWLYARTPHEILFLFGTADEPAADPVADLADLNHSRAAKGLKPVAPGWFAPGVPRR